MEIWRRRQPNLSIGIAIAIAIAWDRDERIERAEKKDQIETDEENALILFGIMFSEEEEKTENPFETSFGAAFRKERESMKKK